jgi:AcrR family transcriptional regulator
MPRLTSNDRHTLVQTRQQQILQAAARVFAEKGFAGATVRDVAKEAGVADGSIYRYFKNKQDILVHLPRQFIVPPLEAFEAANLHSDSPPAPEALLRFMVENLAHVLAENKELVRALISTLPSMDEATRATYFREGPEIALRTLEAYIRAQQQAGTFRSDVDPALATRMLPGMVFIFLIMQEFIQPADMPRYAYEKIIPTVVTIYLHGIMNPDPAPPQPGRKQQKTASRVKRATKISLSNKHLNQKS